ncbi:MAG: leucyl/phenylalanyl-tRNA--protein transferase [Pirellulales bacterium]|nr:leucyl/phenylalanyl-tRNA--protein transferase [Pirellulales bacterium]
MPPSRFFPPAWTADANGLIGFGGKLSPEWLFDAYQHGIFPWPIWGDQDPMAWWSLDPRAIIQFDQFHVSRRMRRTIRSRKFEITFNRDFRGVIHGCATSPGRLGSTWLTGSMIAAYIRFHVLGHAYSVEAWLDSQLAGGVYGVALGGLFAAESMFYRVRDASKVALVELVAHLSKQGYVLIDIQQLTKLTASLGAIEIPRDEYLERLAEAIGKPVSFGFESGMSGESPFLLA